MYDAYVPGALVRHPSHPEWGLGQVQSAIGQRVTVNFEHAGKHTVDVEVVALEVVSPVDLPPSAEPW